MNKLSTYKPKKFDLSGLNGISDQTLEMHFKLYEGYVKETNLLTEELEELTQNGGIPQKGIPAYAEMTRRLGFEYNGMVLHEHYFGNLKRGGGNNPTPNSSFISTVERRFGSYERWKTDFMGVGKMRGVGWAVCFQDPSNGRVSNHWITLHEVGNVAGFRPILIMDIWEHAFLLDYKSDERPKYIEAFFSNIDWSAVEKRLIASVEADV